MAAKIMTPSGRRSVAMMSNAGVIRGCLYSATRDASAMQEKAAVSRLEIAQYDRDKLLNSMMNI
jgi:hypothetical protein